MDQQFALQHQGRCVLFSVRRSNRDPFSLKNDDMANTSIFQEHIKTLNLVKRG